MNVSRQPYGKTVRLKCQADQFKGKSMRRMYSEVVISCHGLILESPVVSSENYLNLPQKRISEMASAAFIETQARALTQDASDLPKIRRQVSRKVRQTIKKLGGDMFENVPVPKKSVRQRKQKKAEGGE
ncbi:MAG: hypothetical protein V1897_19210 [Pseudomonadota bacterium]